MNICSLFVESLVKFEGRYVELNATVNLSIMMGTESVSPEISN